MRISRYIWFPLIFVTLYVVQSLLFNGNISLNKILFSAVSGAIVGCVNLWWNDAKAVEITGRNDEEIFKVRQKRKFSILVDFNRAFELCKEAVNSINPAKIKEENLEKGVIKFRTKLRWDNWGDIITIDLQRITENLTEVEISTRPIPRTVIIGNGRSWKYVEDISNFLKQRDSEINKKVLADSTKVLEDVYIKPFQKKENQPK